MNIGSLRMLRGTSSGWLIDQRGRQVNEWDKMMKDWSSHHRFPEEEQILKRQGQIHGSGGWEWLQAKLINSKRNLATAKKIATAYFLDVCRNTIIAGSEISQNSTT